MSQSFNITVELQARAANVRPAIEAMRSQLQGVSTNIDVGVNHDSLNAFKAVKSSLTGIAQAAHQVNDVFAKGSIGGTTKEFKSMAKQADDAAKSLEGLKNTLDFRSGTKSIANASDEMFRFGQLAALSGRRYAAFSIGALTFVKLTNAIRSSVGEAVEFQRNMVRLGQLGSTSNGEIATLNETITKLSTSLGASSKELADVSIYLKGAGLSVHEVNAALTALAKTSLAPTFKDLRSTTEGLISLRAQFKLTSSDYEEVLGSINTVAKDFAAESEDIIEAVRRSGAAFKAASGDINSPKQSLNEFIALFTSVRSTTRESAESIATSFRTIFARLQSNEVVKNLHDMGIELRYTGEEAKLAGQNIAGQFVGGFNAIKRIQTALKGVPTTDPRYAAIVQQIGGVRQVSKVIPLLQEAESQQQAYNAALSGTNSLTQDADKAQEAFAVRMEKLHQTFSALVREITQSSSFGSLVDLFTSAATAATNLVRALEPVIPLIASLAAVKIGIGFGQFARGFASPQSGRAPRYATGGKVGGGRGASHSDSVHGFAPSGSFIIRKPQASKLSSQMVKHLTSDDGGTLSGREVPIKVMPGEVIVPPKRASQYAGALHEYNKGYSRFASGGSVSDHIAGLYLESSLSHGIRNSFVRALSSEHGKEIASHIPEGSTIAGAGTTAIAYKAPDGDIVRIGGLGDSFYHKNREASFLARGGRRKDSLTLQPKFSQLIGGHTVEKLPYAADLTKQFPLGGRFHDENLSKQLKIVEAFRKRLLKKGLIPTDVIPENLSRHNKHIVAIDADTYQEPDSAEELARYRRIFGVETKQTSRSTGGFVSGIRITASVGKARLFQQPRFGAPQGLALGGLIGRKKKDGSLPRNVQRSLAEQFGGGIDFGRFGRFRKKTFLGVGGMFQPEAPGGPLVSIQRDLLTDQSQLFGHEYAHAGDYAAGMASGQSRDALLPYASAIPGHRFNDIAKQAIKPLYHHVSDPNFYEQVANNEGLDPTRLHHVESFAAAMQAYGHRQQLLGSGYKEHQLPAHLRSQASKAVFSRIQSEVLPHFKELSDNLGGGRPQVAPEIPRNPFFNRVFNLIRNRANNQGVPTKASQDVLPDNLKDILASVKNARKEQAAKNAAVTPTKTDYQPKTRVESHTAQQEQRYANLKNQYFHLPEDDFHSLLASSPETADLVRGAKTITPEEVARLKAIPRPEPEVNEIDEDALIEKSSRVKKLPKSEALYKSLYANRYPGTSEAKFNHALRSHHDPEISKLARPRHGPADEIPLPAHDDTGQRGYNTILGLYGSGNSMIPKLTPDTYFETNTENKADRKQIPVDEFHGADKKAINPADIVMANESTVKAAHDAKIAQLEAGARKLKRTRGAGVPKVLNELASQGFEAPKKEFSSVDPEFAKKLRRVTASKKVFALPEVRQFYEQEHPQALTREYPRGYPESLSTLARFARKGIEGTDLELPSTSTPEYAASHAKAVAAIQRYHGFGVDNPNPNPTTTDAEREAFSSPVPQVSPDVPNQPSGPKQLQITHQPLGMRPVEGMHPPLTIAQLKRREKVAAMAHGTVLPSSGVPIPLPGPNQGVVGDIEKHASSQIQKEYVAKQMSDLVASRAESARKHAELTSHMGTAPIPEGSSYVEAYPHQYAERLAHKENIEKTTNAYVDLKKQLPPSTSLREQMITRKGLQPIPRVRARKDESIDRNELVMRGMTKEAKDAHQQALTVEKARQANMGEANPVHPQVAHIDPKVNKTLHHAAQRGIFGATTAEEAKKAMMSHITAGNVGKIEGGTKHAADYIRTYKILAKEMGHKAKVTQATPNGPYAATFKKIPSEEELLASYHAAGGVAFQSIGDVEKQIQIPGKTPGVYALNARRQPGGTTGTTPEKEELVKRIASRLNVKAQITGGDEGLRRDHPHFMAEDVKEHAEKFKKTPVKPLVSPPTPSGGTTKSPKRRKKRRPKPQIATYGDKFHPFSLKRQRTDAERMRGEDNPTLQDSISRGETVRGRYDRLKSRTEMEGTKATHPPAYLQSGTDQVGVPHTGITPYSLGGDQEPPRFTPQIAPSGPQRPDEIFNRRTEQWESRRPGNTPYQVGLERRNVKSRREYATKLREIRTRQSFHNPRQPSLVDHNKERVERIATEAIGSPDFPIHHDTDPDQYSGFGVAEDPRFASTDALSKFEREEALRRAFGPDKPGFNTKRVKPTGNEIPIDRKLGNLGIYDKFRGRKAVKYNPKKVAQLSDSGVSLYHEQLRKAAGSEENYQRAISGASDIITQKGRIVDVRNPFSIQQEREGRKKAIWDAIGLNKRPFSGGGSPPTPPPNDPYSAFRQGGGSINARPASRLSRIGSKLKGYGTVGLGIGAAAASFAPEIAEHVTGTFEQPGRFGVEGVRRGRQIGGALSGAATGAAIGSLGGPIGTALGAAVGGLHGLVTASQQASKELRNIGIEKAFTRLDSEMGDVITGKKLPSGSSTHEIHRQLGAIDAAESDQNASRAVFANNSLGHGLKSVFGQGGYLHNSYRFLTGATTTADEDATKARFANRQTFVKENIAPRLGEFKAYNETLARDTKIDPRLLQTQGLSSAQLDTNRAERIQAFKDKGGAETAAKIVEATPGLSFDKYYKEIDKIIVETNKERAQISATTKALTAFETETSKFVRISDAVNTTVAAMQNLQHGVDALENAFNGQLSAIPVKSHAAAVADVGGLDTESYNKGVDYVTSSFQGRGSDQLISGFSQQAKGINATANVLPTVIANAAAGGISGVGVKGRIAESLGPEGHNLPQEIVSRIVGVLDTMDDAEIGKAASDNVQKLSDQLIKTGFANVNEVLTNSAKALEDRANNYNAELVKNQEMINKIGESQDKYASLQVNAARSGARLVAEISGRGGQPDLSTETELAPIQQRQERLTGLSGADANNPQLIGNKLRQAHTDVQIATKTRDEASGGNQDIASKALVDLQGKAQNLTKALEELADPVQKNAILQEKLNRQEANRESKLSFTEKLATADPRELAQMQRNAMASDLAVSQGNLVGLSREQRSGALEHLASLGEAQLPAYGGRKASDVRKHLLVNTGLQTGVLSESEERARFGTMKDIHENDKTAVDAQAEVIKDQENLQGQFFSKLQGMQNEFFNKLAVSMAEAMKRDITAQVNDNTGKLAKATAADQARGYFAQKGFNANHIKSLQGSDLGGLADTIEQQQKLQGRLESAKQAAVTGQGLDSNVLKSAFNGDDAGKIALSGQLSEHLNLSTEQRPALMAEIDRAIKENNGAATTHEDRAAVLNKGIEAYGKTRWSELEISKNRQANEISTKVFGGQESDHSGVNDRRIVGLAQDRTNFDKNLKTIEEGKDLNTQSLAQSRQSLQGSAVNASKTLAEAQTRLAKESSPPIQAGSGPLSIPPATSEVFLGAPTKMPDRQVPYTPLTASYMDQIERLENGPELVGPRGETYPNGAASHIVNQHLMNQMAAPSNQGPYPVPQGSKGPQVAQSRRKMPTIIPRVITDSQGIKRDSATGKKIGPYAGYDLRTYSKDSIAEFQKQAGYDPNAITSNKKSRRRSSPANTVRRDVGLVPPNQNQTATGQRNNVGKPPENGKSDLQQLAGVAGMLDKTISNMGTTLNNLASVFKEMKIPENIKVEIGGRQEVVLNGAQLIVGLQKNIAEMVKNALIDQIKVEIPKTVKEMTV